MTVAFEFNVPATSAHLGPGFGVLAIALDLPVAIAVEPESGAHHTVVRRGTMVEPQLDARHDPILRAMLAAAERLGAKLPSGLHIVADSHVPAASGLGTQTAAFAAGAGIAARFSKRAPDPSELLGLIVELGADPAHGGAALAGGLTTACQTSLPREPLQFALLSHPVHESWRFVLALPDHRMPTADARRILPPTLPHAVASRSAGRVVGLLRALAEGNESSLRPFLYDEIHVPHRCRLVPGMETALAAACDAGAAGATISGHGPGVVALTTHEERCADIAAAMLDAFARAGRDADTHTLAATPHGAIPEPV